MTRIFQVDAFTDQLFGGNPAAVVTLESWLNDETLQLIAKENNLAETAFIVPCASDFELRWFTPSSEVALCGHATLATAHVLVTHLGIKSEQINFITRKSGTLTVSKASDGRLSMSFPTIAVEQSEVDLAMVADALGVKPTSLFTGYYSHDEFDYMAVLGSRPEVAQLEPCFSHFEKLKSRGVIVTATDDANDCDFVSRYFAPNFGIEEDPVTGSAHCLLAPYWGSVLNKSELIARQISTRGGLLACSLQQDRTILTGSCVDYLQGEMNLC